MPKPTCKKETMSLLGFINDLGKFLPRLSEIAQPLRDLTLANAQFVWSDQHNKEFDKVKNLVAKHPVLKYYDISEKVNNRSERGIGATLLQNGPSPSHDQRLQLNKDTLRSKKECLVIVLGCQKFSQYITRREKVTVESDHQPLQSILHAPCRLQRTMLRLQRFNLEVVCKTGVQNTNKQTKRLYCSVRGRPPA